MKGHPGHACPALHQVQTFHGDLLQHMEKNTKLDMQFINVSVAPAPPSPQAGPLHVGGWGHHRGQCWHQAALGSAHSQLRPWSLCSAL